MQISKAVITAAGRGARQYPASDTVQKAMLPLVDRDGLTKPVLQIIAEEAFESGIEEICVVSAPGDEAVYRAHFRNYAANLRSTYKGLDWAEEQARRIVDLEQRLQFAVQPEAEGYGHAVWCARSFAAGSRFCCCWETIFIFPPSRRRCARQLIELATAENCAVSAVQATREHLIHQYGTLTGRRLPEHPDIYAIDEIIEKPNPTLAELRLHVPGLRAGHYLCFFGMHVLTPVVFDLLDELVRQNVASWARSSSRRPSMRSREKSGILHWKPAAPALTWESSSASSRPRSPWPWAASTANRSWPSCSNRWSGSSKMSSR